MAIKPSTVPVSFVSLGIEVTQLYMINAETKPNTPDNRAEVATDIMRVRIAVCNGFADRLHLLKVSQPTIEPITTGNKNARYIAISPA